MFSKSIKNIAKKKAQKVNERIIKGCLWLTRGLYKYFRNES